MSDLTFIKINIEKTLDYHHFILVYYGDMIFIFIFYFMQRQQIFRSKKIIGYIKIKWNKIQVMVPTMIKTPLPPLVMTNDMNIVYCNKPPMFIVYTYFFG